jgi:hypothetical protein
VTRTVPEVGLAGRCGLCSAQLFPGNQGGTARWPGKRFCSRHLRLYLEAIEAHVYLELGALEAQAQMSRGEAEGLEDEGAPQEGGEDEEGIDLSSLSLYIWGKPNTDSEDDNE